jgi:protein TonB
MVQQKVTAANTEAVEAEQEGKVRVTIQINRSGQPQQIQVTQSSGHALLDEAAIAAIRRAAPFLPYPESITNPTARLTVRVGFQLR